MTFDYKKYLNDITTAKDHIQHIIWDTIPEIVVVLWSGLWNLAKEVDEKGKIIMPYNEIPWFPKFHSLQWHAGELIFGTLSGKKVILMSWRYHYYEYVDMPDAMKLITKPIRIFQALQIPNLILSNAVGCVNETFQVGELMIIKDHINLMGNNPLLWQNIEELWTRFQPMTNAYTPELRKLAKNIAIKNDIKINEWIYLALTWPTYETQAEYDRVKRQGADTVWMSVVPEVIVAKHSHTNPMNVLGLSVITNLWWSHIDNPPSHEEVVDAANKAMPSMITVVKWVVENIDTIKK